MNEEQKEKEAEIKENQALSGDAAGEPAADELSRCREERDEYLDGWKRAKADFINYKKDEAKRFEGFVKFANEALMRELIMVMDSFDLALQSEETKLNEKTEKGLYLIRQQLADVLRQNGVERIRVEAGEKFNPMFHEAIAEAESDRESGTIIDELERGYMFHGKLLRPARVKIAK